MFLILNAAGSQPWKSFEGITWRDLCHRNNPGSVDKEMEGGVLEVSLLSLALST